MCYIVISMSAQFIPDFHVYTNVVQYKQPDKQYDDSPNKAMSVIDNIISTTILLSLSSNKFSLWPQCY